MITVISSQRSQEISFTGPIMTVYVDDDSSSSFKASTGWLWQFCQRHCIRQLSLQGEKLSLISHIYMKFSEI